MAIKTEIITVDGRELIRHYSDAGKYIRQVETDVEYAEAVDVMPCRYTYEESEREIPPQITEPEPEPEPKPEMTEEQAKALAYDILMGVSE